MKTFAGAGKHRDGQIHGSSNDDGQNEHPYSVIPVLMGSWRGAFVPSIPRYVMAMPFPMASGTQPAHVEWFGIVIVMRMKPSFLLAAFADHGPNDFLVPKRIVDGVLCPMRSGESFF